MTNYDCTLETTVVCSNEKQKHAFTPDVPRLLVQRWRPDSHDCEWKYPYKYLEKSQCVKPINSDTLLLLFISHVQTDRTLQQVKRRILWNLILLKTCLFLSLLECNFGRLEFFCWDYIRKTITNNSVLSHF